MSNAVLKSEPQAIVACTISRDVQIFDLLIEDMEAALGENWVTSPLMMQHHICTNLRRRACGL